MKNPFVRRPDRRCPEFKTMCIRTALGTARRIDGRNVHQYETIEQCGKAIRECPEDTGREWFEYWGYTTCIYRELADETRQAV